MTEGTEQLNAALRRAGEAAAVAAKALATAVCILGACALKIAKKYDGNVDAFLEAARVQAALKEAPPRIQHLAKYSKKNRVRKKNINRALREYQKESRQ